MPEPHVLLAFAVASLLLVLLPGPSLLSVVGRSPRRLAGMEAGGGAMMVGLGGSLASTATRA